MEEYIYKYTNVSYFHEEPYSFLKPKSKPLQSTASQIKLVPVQYKEYYRFNKENEKIYKWYQLNHYEINRLFKKSLGSFKKLNIKLNTDPKKIYNEFVYMIYYKFMNNYIDIKGLGYI